MTLGVVQRYHLGRAIALIKVILGWNENALQQVAVYDTSIFDKNRNQAHIAKFLRFVETYGKANKKLEEDVELLSSTVAEKYNELEQHLPAGDEIRVYMLLKSVAALLEDCEYICPELKGKVDFQVTLTTVSAAMAWLQAQMTQTELEYASLNGDFITEKVAQVMDELDSGKVYWYNGKWFSDKEKYVAYVKQCYAEKSDQEDA